MPATTNAVIDRKSGFSAEIWDSIRPTYEAIASHPFLVSVVDGSLPPERFVFFVEQDRLYLQAFSRALSYTAGHAEDADAVGLFTGSAAAAIAVEAGMHVELLDGFGVDLAAADEARLTPTGELYVQTILAHSSRGPFSNAVASVLACYWIYAEVGKELIEKGSPDPRYQRWIDTYGDPEFAATVGRVLDVVDEIGANGSEAERARFQAIFAQGCRLEWMFWDAAWRQETWPFEINEGI